MRGEEGARGQIVFPRPGKTLKGVMLALFGVWLLLAVGLNWGGLPPEVFRALAGNTDAILDGEVWRLVTAPVIHTPSGTIGHILFALLVLYFFGTALEEGFGGPRFVRFLVASAVIGYVCQILVTLAVSDATAEKLVGEYWYGAAPALEALAIAWALSFRGRTVLLFFVLPVTSKGLIVFVVGASIMTLLAGATPPEGLVAPFGGMFAGWLLGAGTPSPLRRLWLKWRLAQLDADARRGGSRRDRIARSKLRSIRGGRSEDKDDASEDEPRRFLN